MTDREDKIRQRAYNIWEEEGHPHGRHEDHWHRAMAEVETTTPAQGELIPEIAGAPGLVPADTAPAKKAAPKRRKVATAAAEPSEPAPKTKSRTSSTTKKRTTAKKS